MNLIKKIEKIFTKESYKFIWGISACDSEAGLYNANDFDIVYNVKDKKYYLGIETAFLFDSPDKECSYLEETLEEFTKYMVSTGKSTDIEYPFFCSRLNINWKADSIEELYMNFKIFVNGYCSVYKKNRRKRS